MIKNDGAESIAKALKEILTLKKINHKENRILREIQDKLIKDKRVIIYL